MRCEAGRGSGAGSVGTLNSPHQKLKSDLELDPQGSEAGQEGRRLLFKLPGLSSRGIVPGLDCPRVKECLEVVTFSKVDEGQKSSFCPWVNYSTSEALDRRLRLLLLLPVQQRRRR